MTINIADSGVIDVGYAGTIGADRITHGEPIYGEGEFPDDNRFGDTYGPVNYYAYVPFELALPWSGEWDELAGLARAPRSRSTSRPCSASSSAARACARAARAASSASSLAFAWLAYPYTAFALQSNSNDSLVAALLVWSLALFARPLARGALLALAVMAKFAPLALVPLYAAGERGLLDRGARDDDGSRRRSLRPVAAFARRLRRGRGADARPPGDRSGPRRRSSIAPSSARSTAARRSASGARSTGSSGCRRRFSSPRRCSPWSSPSCPGAARSPQVAALAAAVLIALQLSVDHWFYLYIPWFFGPLLIALVAIDSADKREAPVLDELAVARGSSRLPEFAARAGRSQLPERVTLFKRARLSSASAFSSPALPRPRPPSPSSR